MNSRSSQCYCYSSCAESAAATDGFHVDLCSTSLLKRLHFFVETSFIRLLCKCTVCHKVSQIHFLPLSGRPLTLSGGLSRSLLPSMEPVLYEREFQPQSLLHYMHGPFVANHSNCQASMLRRPLSFALPARRLVPEMSKLRTFYLSASVYLHASCVCTYVNVYIRTYIHMYLLTHLPTSTYPATHIHK